MKATQELHEMGQSLWLDNLTRGLLTSGTLRRYIQDGNPDTMKEPGVSKKSTLGSGLKPQVYPFQETPECYTLVSTSTSGS